MKTTVSAIALLLSFSTLCLASTSSLAKIDIVEVNFDNHQKYTDIQYFGGSKKKFHKRLFADWTTFLNKESEKILPENYRLKIKFNDIDLAGTYLLNSSDHHRIVRDIDYPRLKLSYQLFNGEQLVKEADVTLKDMNFLRHNLNRRSFVENYYHEKKLLKTWLKKEIKTLVNS